MSEALLDEPSIPIDEAATKDQIGSEQAEILIARGSIAGRILAQTRLSEAVQALPAEVREAQEREIAETLAGLQLQQELPDRAVVAWYRRQREVSVERAEASGNPIEDWLSLAPHVLGAMSVLASGSSEDEAFEQLGLINDAAEAIFNRIGEVTAAIEAAREISDEVYEPAEEDIVPIETTEPPVEAEIAPEVPTESASLNLPEDFMDRLQYMLTRQPTVHISEIVRELVGVRHMERRQFLTLRTILNEAAEQGVMKNLDRGYYVAANSLITEPPMRTAAQRARSEKSLEAKLKSLKLGTPFSGKPKQRGRSRSSRK